MALTRGLDHEALARTWTVEMALEQRRLGTITEDDMRRIVGLIGTGSVAPLPFLEEPLPEGVLSAASDTELQRMLDTVTPTQRIEVVDEIRRRRGPAPDFSDRTAFPDAGLRRLLESGNATNARRLQIIAEQRARRGAPATPPQLDTGSSLAEMWARYDTDANFGDPEAIAWFRARGFTDDATIFAAIEAHNDTIPVPTATPTPIDDIDEGQEGTDTDTGDTGETATELLDRLAREREAMFGRRTQFLESRGLPAAGGGPAGAFGRSQFEPFETLFNLQDRFSPLTGQGPGSFTQALLDRVGGISETRTGARDLLRRISGFDRDERESRGFGFTDLFDADGVRLPTGQDSGQLADTDVRALLSLGLRNQFGRLGARHITGRLGTERDIFNQAQAQGTNTENNFLNSLLSKFNVTF